MLYAMLYHADTFGRGGRKSLTRSIAKVGKSNP
jgi:hypothetical protein